MKLKYTEEKCRDVAKYIENYFDEINNKSDL